MKRQPYGASRRLSQLCSFCPLDQTYQLYGGGTCTDRTYIEPKISIAQTSKKFVTKQEVKAVTYKKYSDYISRYIEQTNIESKNLKHPKWIRDFFSIFNDELYSNAKSASPGNKNIITSSFRVAFVEKIAPKEIHIQPEVQISCYIDESRIESEDLKKLLSTKRVDFVAKNSSSSNNKELVIEFKSNIQFNDFSAAIVQMAAIKRFLKKDIENSIITASLHLFPFKANTNGLKALNSELWHQKAIDHIWILCNPLLEFNIGEIKKLRADISRLLG